MERPYRHLLNGRAALRQYSARQARVGLHVLAGGTAVQGTDLLAPAHLHARSPGAPGAPRAVRAHLRSVLRSGAAQR